jgi:predicted TPR repeat methyltransferase
MNTHYSLPPTLKIMLNRLMPKGKLSILDLGCGRGIAGWFFNQSHDHRMTGVDVFKPYLKEAKTSGYYQKLVESDVTKFPIAKESYDVILLFQVLEHLPKKEGIALLKKMTRGARKAVIVTLPHGECEQEDYEENKYQKHLSSWMVKDLENLGFNVYGQGLKAIYGSESYGYGKKIKLWQQIAVPLSTILSPIIYFCPQLGAQLIAVKYNNS